MHTVIQILVTFIIFTSCALFEQKKSKKREDLPRVEIPLTRPLAGFEPGTQNKIVQGEVCTNQNLMPQQVLDAPYIYKIQEVCDIDPIVLREDPNMKRERPQESQIDRSFDDWAHFTKEFINSSMQKESLKPGRTLDVFVIDDESENAQAKGNLFFNNTLVQNANSESLAFITCHEIAHEVRNHSLILDAEIERTFSVYSDALLRFSQQYLNYRDAQIDMVKRRYRHSQFAFDALVKDWQYIVRDLSAKSRRAESEADMVAVKLCSEFGFRLNEITKGIFDFFEPRLSDSHGMDWVDGKLYPIDSNIKDDDELLIKILMAYIETHPKPYERLQQYNANFTAFPDMKSTLLANNWREYYGKKQVASIALHSGEDSDSNEFLHRLKGAFHSSMGSAHDGCGMRGRLAFGIKASMARN